MTNDYSPSMEELDRLAAAYNKRKAGQEESTPQEKIQAQNSIVGAPAPKLDWYGDKWNNKGTYDANKRPSGAYFYQLPMPIMDYICNILDGKNGMLLKIMMAFIGTDKGFGISEKWICDRIGIKGRDKTRSYYRAREDLNKMGWIEYDGEKHKIYVCYDFLWQEAFTPPENRQPVLEWKKEK